MDWDYIITFEDGNDYVDSLDVDRSATKLYLNYSFKDVPYTEGVGARVDTTVTDKEGNTLPDTEYFVVDTLAATIATVTGNPVEELSSTKTRILYDGSTVADPITLEFSTENVYELIAKVYVDNSDYAKEPYLPKGENCEGIPGVVYEDYYDFKMNGIHYRYPAFDKRTKELAVDLVEQLQLTVSGSPATVHFILTDYAGNQSEIWIKWNELTTAKRWIVADWDKIGKLPTEENLDVEYDLIKYTPLPFMCLNFTREREVFSDETNAHWKVEFGEIKIPFYVKVKGYDPETDRYADLFIEDKDGNWNSGNGNGLIYDYSINPELGGYDNVIITLKNNTGADFDLDDADNEFTVHMLSATGPDDDPLWSDATITFYIPDLDPESADIAATLLVGQITGMATLVIEVATKVFNDRDVLDFIEEASGVSGKLLSMWFPGDAETGMRFVEATDLKYADHPDGPICGTNYKNSNRTLVVTLTTGKYNDVFGTEHPYYILRIQSEGLRYYLTGSNGLYEANDEQLDGIVVNVVPLADK